MTKGQRVARVSLRSDEGGIGDTGTIEQVFEFEAGAFGYRVIWDQKPRESQYVAPVRIVELEAYRVDQSRKAIA